MSEDIEVSEAVEAARADFAKIKAAVDYLLPTFHDSDSYVIVDGQAFSPSWRRMPNGAAIYSSGDAEAIEEYEWELDCLVGAYTDPTRGGSLGWSDGCLWFYGADYDGEEF